MRPASGIALWDLKFRGERIVYELSLQELFIAYNSYSGAGTTYFLVCDKPSLTVRIHQQQFLEAWHLREALNNPTNCETSGCSTAGPGSTSTVSHTYVYSRRTKDTGSKKIF
jgi:hypothetical protein